MAKYRFTNKAVEDLSNIWNYTVKTWSERQADLYYRMLIELCRDIADNPALGKNYEEISESLYGFIANKHIIFYRVISQDEVEIVRILHGSMDLKSRIGE
ncbi:toxin ParE1/3/4 [Parabacteroides sp. PF5-5]|uniref:type II toxin-antitoxin system RelE/ParE family toxin n=1 Tax=unclassified Parabacteroides TaxID=2649774 RepID=UPI002475B349|nr:MULTISPECIES: type II toxin-antitoxin system RelE/ParE family toxin [unclassified Parabacteroides]MDH6303432.1 toxin ParE1/3/4 [Parabacteroides sp. PH5-39]MDH6314755.1 toxin ParE1/3/4 [Parabacteroides sp. PF5-13]MDH6318092.1 toxin ParE1/3/4 [Parabacteroides sp. PH5-13]MDH6321977.1 toxin ParE1/3/4 [Parabacteroides sp. PH5-8]MDH6326100.1 toxin ParE1/3/4 [Parabacteroides sp. PH5-41]